MNAIAGTLDTLLADRADRLFKESLFQTHKRTDRMFAALMALQWVAGIALAMIVSPRTWAGTESAAHLHVWLAVAGGLLFMGPAVALAIWAPGRPFTRHVIAIGQMLESALLIHITGGRIETHFHVFGSLAFLSFYRDWRVLVTGSIVVAGDHVLRGLFWPQSVYGVLIGDSLRWLEHAGWVAFIDAFLIQAGLLSVREMRATSRRQARLEAHQSVVESEVERRTKELRESEEKFRQMAEHIDEVFWVVSADMSEMQYVSPAYERIWGRSLAYLKSHPGAWAEAIHPEDRERVWKEASSHRDRGTYEVTYRIVRPDGTVRWLYDHGSAVRNEKGEVIRLAGSAVDITALKESEERLVRSNLELERFAYVASHDLQEPLRTVSSFLQLLQRRYRGRLDSDADEFIRFAVDGAHRMKGLIADLLAYSRLNSQARPMESVDVNVVHMIAIENLQQAIQESGARITHDPLPVITADGAQIAQVLQNLLGNAIKFRGERAPVIHVGARRTAEGWTFSVKDNGIGIEPEYAEKIFVIFQRLNGPKYPGSGIGLTICRKIVERHLGRIWVEPTPGEGTTFHFSLPAAPAAPAAPAFPAAPLPRARRVLVVEDDPLVRKLIRTTLESIGISVETAESGPEGLEKARLHRPSALLLDVNLPGLDGNRVRRALSADHATRDIPVVMMTAEADLLDPEFAVAADWLPKPLSTADLCRRMEDAVK